MAAGGDKKGATVVIRNVRKVKGGGHHGGAWKVAYADFVTAMMAFFLVMWLVGSTTNKQRAAISEYFKNPSAIEGKSVSPAPGPNGPGGASTSMIQLGGTMEIPHGPGPEQFDKKKTPPPGSPDAEAGRKQARAEEIKRLDDLYVRLNAAIEHSQALQPYKDQLLLDITPEGLRVQVVDKQSRPMFDLGGTALKPYTVSILRELAGFINAVPNRISITGHTDINAYSNDEGYTNWELSADRANTARRALVAGGMTPDKVALVVGMGSSAPFNKDDPRDPMNRRISIVVMSQQSEAQALARELAAGDDDGQLRADAGPAAAASPGGGAAAGTYPAAQAAAAR